MAISSLNAIKCSILILLGVLAPSGAAPYFNITSESSPKSFSLFTVVTFPNRQCVVLSDTTMRGNCLTSEECQSRGGIADGNCASGFGVCCKFVVEACSDVTVQKNCTYIQNPGYSGAWTDVSTTCSFTVMAVNSNICQLRFDFDDVVLAAPTTTNGECSTTDTLTVTSPTGRSPPYICGTVSGSHMYSETGLQTQAGVIAIQSSSTAQTRRFKIKITQIECNSISKAPTDCVQYFTASSGTIETYNFGRILRNQHYDYCFRQNIGYCMIDYKESTSTSPDSFALGTQAIAIRNSGNCGPRRVQILTNVNGPTTANNLDTYCGGHLSPTQGDTEAGVVRGTSLPFALTFFSTGTAAAASTITGFQINYNQVPCGSQSLAN